MMLLLLVAVLLTADAVTLNQTNSPVNEAVSASLFLPATELQVATGLLGPGALPKLQFVRFDAADSLTILRVSGLATVVIASGVNVTVESLELTGGSFFLENNAVLVATKTVVIENGAHLGGFGRVESPEITVAGTVSPGVVGGCDSFFYGAYDSYPPALGGQLTLAGKVEFELNSRINIYNPLLSNATASLLHIEGLLSGACRVGIPYVSSKGGVFVTWTAGNATFGVSRSYITAPYCVDTPPPVLGNGGGNDPCPSAGSGSLSIVLCPGGGGVVFGPGGPGRPPPVTCLNDCSGALHGTCVAQDVCQCISPWYGDICDKADCGCGAGVCDVLSGQLFCECDRFNATHWRHGPSCLQLIAGCPPCVHGTCVADACVCDANYRGYQCSVPVCPGYSASTNQTNCNGNGECQDGQCACVAGFEGPSCSLRVVEENVTPGGSFPVGVIVGIVVGVVVLTAVVAVVGVLLHRRKTASAIRSAKSVLAGKPNPAVQQQQPM